MKIAAFALAALMVAAPASAGILDEGGGGRFGGRGLLSSDDDGLFKSRRSRSIWDENKLAPSYGREGRTPSDHRFYEPKVGPLGTDRMPIDSHDRYAPKIGQ